VLQSICLVHGLNINVIITNAKIIASTTHDDSDVILSAYVRSYCFVLKMRFVRFVVSMFVLRFNIYIDRNINFPSI